MGFTCCCSATYKQILWGLHTSKNNSKTNLELYPNTPGKCWIQISKSYTLLVQKRHLPTRSSISAVIWIKKSSSYCLPRNQSLGISASLSRVSISSNSSFFFKTRVKAVKTRWWLMLVSLFACLLCVVSVHVVVVVVVVVGNPPQLPPWKINWTISYTTLTYCASPQYFYSSHHSHQPTKQTNRRKKTHWSTSDTSSWYDVFFAFSTRRFIHPKW